VRGQSEPPSLAPPPLSALTPSGVVAAAKLQSPSTLRPKASIQIESGLFDDEDDDAEEAPTRALPRVLPLGPITKSTSGSKSAIPTPMPSPAAFLANISGATKADRDPTPPAGPEGSTPGHPTPEPAGRSTPEPAGRSTPEPAGRSTPEPAGRSTPEPAPAGRSTPGHSTPEPAPAGHSTPGHSTPAAIPAEQAEDAPIRTMVSTDSEQRSSAAVSGAFSSSLPRPGRLIPHRRREGPALGRSGKAVVAAEAVAAVPETAQPGVPKLASPQDTASLISGLTDEIVGESMHEAAVTVQVETPAHLAAVAQDARDAQDARRRRGLWIAAGIAALLCVVVAVALLASRNGTPEPEDRSARTDDQDRDQDQNQDPAEPGPELAVADDPQPTETGADPDVDPSTAGDPGETGSEAPDTDALDLGDEQPVADLTPQKPKSKPKSKPKAEPKPEPKAEPKPAPKPKPEPKPKDTRSAAQLYDAAKKAYSKGNARGAYDLALASQRKKKKSKTAELLTLSACKLHSAGKASSALRAVTPIRRGAIKKQCKNMGVTIK